MDEGARELERLRAVVVSTTTALAALRDVDDPAVADLVRELEKARAEAMAALAEIGANRPR